MMDDLMAKVTLEGNQYGGLRGSGTDHLLAEMVTTTMSNLDDNHAFDSVFSLDFCKALNKMDHTTCLRALADKIASNQSINFIHSFLNKCCMKVKLGESLSSEKRVPGGAPQGTKSGNFLYCITVDGIERRDFIDLVGRYPNYAPLATPAPDAAEEEVADLPTSPPPYDWTSRYGVPELPQSTLGYDRGLGLSNLASQIDWDCLLYTSPSPRDRQKSRMPSSA